MELGRTALIAGGSGFIGGFCLHYLLRDPRYERVYALVRRKLPISHPRLTQILADFDDLADMPGFPRVQDVFCCLGTPLHRIRNRSLLERVDHDYPLALATRAHERGAARFIIVTSSGIGPRSPLFYCRLKSKLESRLRGLGFPMLVVLRPSLLLGKPSSPRPLQRWIGLLIQPFLFLFRGPLGPFRPLPAEAVGYAMVWSAFHVQGEFQELGSSKMHGLFKKRGSVEVVGPT